MCGGRSPVVGPPWNPEDRPFFDDGVDLIENPIALSGAWGGRQKNWMEGRIQLSDVVAVVEIRSIQTEIDAAKQASKRLEATVIESLYGTTPGNRIMLKSRSDAPGFPLLSRHESRLGGRFILFYRHFVIDEGKSDSATGHHFHLSPASDTLLDHVEERIRFRVSAESE